jgi:hypothetical protein
VCNHPDLFEPRRIVSAFDAERIDIRVPSLVAQCAGSALSPLLPDQDETDPGLVSELERALQAALRVDPDGLGGCYHGAGGGDGADDAASDRWRR